MRVHAEHSLGDLASDLAKIPVLMVRESAKIVREDAKDGAQTARRIAKWTAGRAGKHYPKSITADPPRAVSAFGGGSISAEYGPDPARPQGGMSFEHGSRNQKPHLDLAQSADIVAPQFHRHVSAMLDRLFWPGA